jgi:hypothetical protein
VRRCRLLFAIPVLALAACSGGDKPADDAAAPAASAAPAAPRGADADMADIADYRLSMDKMDNYYKAQRNLMAAFSRMTPAERDAAKMTMEEGGETTLDDMAAKYERVPVVKAAIADAGFSPREFTVMTMAMVQAGMAASVIQMRPNDDADSLAREMKANMDNIRFLQENEAELTRKQKELEAEMQAAGMG